MESYLYFILLIRTILFFLYLLYIYIYGNILITFPWKASEGKGKVKLDRRERGFSGKVEGERGED